MILQSRIIRVGLVVCILGHTVGLELESAHCPGLGGSVPEGRLEEGMSPHVMQLGHDVVITVGGRQGLEIVERGILPGRRTTVAPLAPVTRRIAGLCQNVPHGQVLRTDCLLRVVWIVSVCKSVTLMKSGLLGRTGGGTYRASIPPAEIHPGSRQAVQVRSQHIGLACSLALDLTIRANRTPPHVVDVEVEDIRTLRGRRKGSQQDDCKENERADFFHLRHIVILRISIVSCKG